MRRSGLRCAVAGLLFLASDLRAQQPSVVVADVGPGTAGRIVRDVLRRPHRLVEPDTAWFVLRRSESVRTNLVLLGRTGAIAGKVDGDVVVVGGDLFVRPGAEISGRAVAIGGGVYSSTLAFIGQGVQSHRDQTFRIERTADGYRLAYQSLRVESASPMLFPYLYGFRAPTYDRVNGITLPFGPTLSFAGGRGFVEATAAYRSDLGVVDPRLGVAYQFTRTLRANLEVQRGTFSNEDWIWPDFVNSLAVFVAGTDSRNYHRADRGELTVHHLFDFTETSIEPLLGVRAERAWPVGPTIGDNRGPWSVFGRTNLEGMLRPNPQIPRSSLLSALGGAALVWQSESVQVSARTIAESPIDASAPAGTPFVESRFTQLTSDLNVGFPTFRNQEYEVDVHWVTTFGDTPPAQRFVYLGGPGTLPFLNMLEQGGDELLLVDQRYAIPLERVRIGFLGMPTIQLRHRIGSAGLGGLPDFEQMVGVGVSLTVIRAELQIDPTDRRFRFGGGFTFSR